MEEKILNFDNISKGNIDVYVYINGMYPQKGILTGFFNFNKNNTYTDDVSLMVHSHGTFHLLTFDVLKVSDNNTDHLEIKYNNRRPTFITTSKMTMKDYMRKDLLTSPLSWIGKLNIQSNFDRKTKAKDIYQEFIKYIKNL